MRERGQDGGEHGPRAISPFPPLFAWPSVELTTPPQWPSCWLRNPISNKWEALACKCRCAVKRNKKKKNQLAIISSFSAINCSASNELACRLLLSLRRANPLHVHAARRAASVRRKLRCPRNVLHMHLFASFVLRAFMTLLKDSLFVAGLGTSGDFLEQREGSYDYFRQTQGNWECKMIISIWQYCIKANYSWILMEGLYLHNLIFQALITDSSSIMWYIVLGWGLPSIFVIPWTICRAKLEDTLCWTTNDDKFVFLLIRGPTMASILVNFVLFIRIVAVLLRKLQSSVCEETQTYRRWAKSTLVLIPLFGVHYTLFFGLQFGTNSAVEIVWLYCDQLFTSFNGYGVALLYCFLNGEVRAEVARKWRSFSLGEALERSIFSGGRLARGRRPRGSCYSSASCTLDSVVHSGRADKKRPHVALKAPRAKVKGTFGKHGRRPSSERALERNAVELERLPSSNDV